MGKSVGLPEMWVLIALFVGGEIFGFLGVLLAVPGAAVAKIFATRAYDIYHESDLYLDGPASLRSIPPGEPVRSSSFPPGVHTVPSMPIAANIPPVRSSTPPPPAAPPAGDVKPPPPQRVSTLPSATTTPSSAFETPLAGSVIPPKSEPPRS